MEPENKLEKLKLLHLKMIEEVQDYAIILLDVDGTVMTWNKGVEKIKGYTEEEIVGENFSIFYPPGDQEAGLPQNLLDRAAREGSVKHVGRRLRKDGSSFTASIVITALHDEEGNIIGYTKLTHEVREYN